MDQKGIIGKPGSDKNRPLGNQGMTVDFFKSKRRQKLYDYYLSHTKEKPAFSLRLKQYTEKFYGSWQGAKTDGTAASGK